jgi:hypothetical protein
MLKAATGPFWLYSTDERLTALIDRAEALRDYLTASAAECPRFSLARQRFQDRLGVVNGRLARLYTRRRQIRTVVRLEAAMAS